MGKNLFVAGLDYSITDDQLNDLFAQYGSVVSAKVIFDREKNRSKGFGFVEMGTPEEADSAIKALNETEVQGRSIIVKEARPKTEFSGGGGGGGNKFSGNRQGGGNSRYGKNDNGQRDW